MLKITFEFVGGPNDGVSLEGTLGDASDAERYYLFTNHGTVGQRFKVASEFAVETLAQEPLQEERRYYFQPHHYVVTDRLEENNEVLVRSEYLDKKEEQDSPALVREHLEPTPVETPSGKVKTQRLVQLTAESLAESYSHSWPADKEGAPHPSYLCLHLAHVMLCEKFTVFAGAAHPEPAQDDIDLVGVAPSQDWFVACQLKPFVDRESLQEWLPEVRRLRSFWLSGQLTIEACGEHIHRLARHCQAGHALAVAGHWAVEEDPDPELLAGWRNQGTQAGGGGEFAENLAAWNAQWFEPIAVRQYDGRGTFYLLGATFRISR